MRIPSGLEPEWFNERYHEAADQVIETFGAEFFSLTGATVADIGCGDGIIDLGIFHKTSPARLVGFDIVPTDTAALLRLATGQGVEGELPSGLEFRTSPAERLEAGDGEFDLAFSWSGFHHIANTEGALAELHRVLRPGGALMLQLHPFSDSAHGELLEQWYPDGFAQLRVGGEEIEAHVRAHPGPDPAWAEHVLAMRRGLNRITLDRLGDLLQACSLRVTRLHLIAEDTALPPEAAGRSLSSVGVAGVRLLAVRV